MRWPKQGVKKILVMCPAFVADCIETLEEIGDRGREQFIEAGGEELVLVPCLNDNPQWAAGVEHVVRKGARQPLRWRLVWELAPIQASSHMASAGFTRDGAGQGRSVS
jgi:hypothetical protein